MFTATPRHVLRQVIQIVGNKQPTFGVILHDGTFFTTGRTGGESEPLIPKGTIGRRRRCVGL